MASSWESSNRRAELPADWDRRVFAIKARARGRCEWLSLYGIRCPDPGRDVDHRTDPDDHDDLWLLCKHHHDAKTTAEALAAKGAIKARGTRPARPHPNRREEQ